VPHTIRGVVSRKHRLSISSSSTVRYHVCSGRVEKDSTRPVHNRSSPTVEGVELDLAATGLVVIATERRHLSGLSFLFGNLGCLVDRVDGVRVCWQNVGSPVLTKP
jgi:hypothetical protein